MVTRFSIAAPVRSTYFVSRLLSQAGQGLFFATLFLIAGTGDGSAAGLSSVLIAMILGAILFGLPGGALADKLGPSRALAIGAALRLSSIAMGAVLLSGAGEFAWAVAFMYSTASQLFSPAELALIPAIEPKRAGRAHAILIVLQYAGQGVGMLALAPLLYFVGGTGAMMVGALAMYVGVVALAATLAVALRDTRVDYQMPARRAFDISGTFRFFAADPRAMYAAALLAFTEVSLKGLTVAVPPYIRDDLTLSQLQLGGAVALGITGSIVGLVWCGRALTLERAAFAMRMTFGVMSASLLALAALGWMLAEVADIGALAVAGTEVAFDPTVAVAFPIGMFLGAAVSVALIGSRSVLTETAPARQHSRVFATQAVLNDIAVLVPLLVAGIGTELASARVTFGFIGGVGVLALFALERMSRASAGEPIPTQPLAARDASAA